MVTSHQSRPFQTNGQTVTRNSPDFYALQGVQVGGEDNKDVESMGLDGFTRTVNAAPPDL